MSDLIFPSIAPNLRVAVVGNKAADLAGQLGVTIAPLDECDAAIFIVDSTNGVSASDQETWAKARELYIPSVVAITDIEKGEIDFDDLSAIASRLLDPVITPYLVLHEESGAPIALINLESLKLIDYSGGSRQVKDSDPEHKVLVFEFRKEFLEALEEFGQDSFQQGLTFPAIPYIQSIGIGKYEILEYLASLPSRS